MHQSAGRHQSPGDSLSPRVNPSPPPANSPEHRPDDRAGIDARQRGWYWHWNGIVTQYAPLIGLKGVGLLNSYTVWTDRRDKSPTRGYAFPSQQSESSFYGEDRAELITINKILVALDLVEIRKEMVQRTDPQGRKWKVPHNLYRVKDRTDGLELQTADVLRVVELAGRDAAVFRYIKRIFSSRFTPIDRDNVWHRILKEVAGDPTWQELTEKTARIEARASARSKAGHKSRGKQEQTENGQDTFGAGMTAGHSDVDAFDTTEHNNEGMQDVQTSVAHSNAGPDFENRDVATGNNGSEPDVDHTNTGSRGGDASSAEATNNGPASVVAPSNATYYQEISTTTTTTVGSDVISDNGRATGAGGHSEQQAIALDQGSVPETAGPSGLDDNAAALQTTDKPGVDRTGKPAVQRSLADPAAGGPLVGPGPLVVSLFEAANNRSATPLERTLLGELERDAAEPASRCGETGADWVAAAMREAVSSGSSFVAPKRIREIINRWASTGSRPGPPKLSPPALDATEDAAPGGIRLPRGRSADRVWRLVLDELAGALDEETHQRLFEGSRIAAYRSGQVEIEVPSAAQPKLSAEYRPLLQRHLEQHIGRKVTVSFVASQAVSNPQTDPSPEPILISQADAEQGRQLWRAVLNEIAPVVSADDLVRLGGALPLGQDAEGHIVVGTSTSLAARLIGGRCRNALEAAMQAVIGDRVVLRVAAHGTWKIEEDEAES
jgi:hypothetical protein